MTQKTDPSKKNYLNDKGVEFILQHGIGYTNAHNAKPILATIYIGSNTIVIGYNTLTKTAALLHMDEVTSHETVNLMLNYLGNEKISVNIIFKNTTPKSIIEQIIKKINNHSSLRIKKIKYNNTVAIDSRNGIIIDLPENQIKFSESHLHVINQRKSREIYVKELKNLNESEVDLLLEMLQFKEIMHAKNGCYPVIIEYDCKTNNQKLYNNNFINTQI